MRLKSKKEANERMRLNLLHIARIERLNKIIEFAKKKDDSKEEGKVLDSSRIIDTSTSQSPDKRDVKNISITEKIQKTNTRSTYVES